VTAGDQQFGERAMSEVIYRKALDYIESKLRISHSFKFNDLIGLLPGSGAV